MLPYQLDHGLLKGTSAKVMHDMPSHPGYEIWRELLKDPRLIIFHQAEDPLEAQKAVIRMLLDRANT